MSRQCLCQKTSDTGNRVDALRDDGTDQTGKFIYVVNGRNEVEYRRIDTGSIIDDTMRLVTKGLAAGERYVTKALLKVRNGMTIDPIME